MVDSFFDAENFENPIGTSITDSYYYKMLPGYTKMTEIYVMQNKLELMDSFYQYGNPEEQTFYSLSGGYKDTQVKITDAYINTYFFIDSKVTTHKRTVYSLLDMLSQLGGVFQVVKSLSFVILGYYAEKMMYYCLIRKLYQLESPPQTNSSSGNSQTLDISNGQLIRTTSGVKSLNKVTPEKKKRTPR